MNPDSAVERPRRGDGSFVRPGVVTDTRLSEAEKASKLGELYERMKSEASGFSISENEMQRYLLRRNEE